MKFSDTFSLTRFANLITLDVVKNKWLYLLLFESVTGLVLFIFVLFGVLKQNDYNYSLLAGWAFLIVGIIISGFAFNELPRKTDNYNYLLLPASVFEKYLLKVLFLFVLFPLIMLLSLLTVNLIGNFFNDILFSAKNVSIKAFQIKLPLFINAYLIVFPVFLFGSVYFKELGLVKVILSTAGILFTLTLFVLVIYKILFWNSVDGFGFFLKKEFVFAYPTVHKALPLLQDVVDSVVFGIKYLFAPFFLLLSFIALKEKEV